MMMQRRMAVGAVKIILQRMTIAHRTGNRPTLADELERLIREVDKHTGNAPRLTARQRALCLMTTEPLTIDVGSRAVRAYVWALVSGVPAATVESRLAVVSCPRLVRRYLRYGMPVNRKELQRVATVAELMAC